jgi:hypothetical protein
VPSDADHRTAVAARRILEDQTPLGNDGGNLRTAADTRGERVRVPPGGHSATTRFVTH